ncbi:hypothetical protein K7472_24855 [Streptomyces sp. PTM05]|uniref:Uncharacterized protein n=1 Tax=Streptantibioticus parmotrematis TaxID=2873249 RepID=A0ABS7R0G3_9ACTN|nr:hypothetical protein [Streptantibioticus parmotrematis]MBY8888045.1 hypothetical protein [Streptantibioticus parmotrematis]
MSTHTQATTPSDPASQGTHQYVITLEIPGSVSGTYFGTCSPVDSTRHDVFTDLRRQIALDNPDLARGNVVFFALEPNQL